MSFIDDLTNCNERQRRQLGNYYSQLAEAEKAAVHRRADKLFHRLRSRARGQDTGEFQLALLVIAARDYRTETETRLTERHDTTTEQIAELRRRRIARVIQSRAGNKAPLAAAIQRYRNDIHELRDAGLSWPEISRYLIRHHANAFVRSGKKAHVDPRYLARTWTQLTASHRPGDSGDLMDD